MRFIPFDNETSLTLVYYSWTVLNLILSFKVVQLVNKKIGSKFYISILNCDIFQIGMVLFMGQTLQFCIPVYNTVPWNLWFWRICKLKADAPKSMLHWHFKWNPTHLILFLSGISIRFVNQNQVKGIYVESENVYFGLCPLWTSYEIW